MAIRVSHIDVSFNLLPSPLRIVLGYILRSSMSGYYRLSISSGESETKMAEIWHLSGGFLVNFFFLNLWMFSFTRSIWLYFLRKYETITDAVLTEWNSKVVCQCMIWIKKFLSLWSDFHMGTRWFLANICGEWMYRITTVFTNRIYRIGVVEEAILSRYHIRISLAWTISIFVDYMS